MTKQVLPLSVVMEGRARISYGKPEFSLHKFDGVLDGKKVYMTLNYPAKEEAK